MRSTHLRAAPMAALMLAAACLLAAAPARAALTDWRWPVSGAVITPYRNGADPYAGGQHRGIDIGAPVGTRVVAAASGTVSFAGSAGSSGLTVALRTADGRYETTYLHLASIDVHAGQSLSTGDVVGTVGTTGRRSAAEPHLHFGVRDAGDRFGYHDPLDFLPGPPAAPEPSPQPVPLPLGAPVFAGPSLAAAVSAPAAAGPLLPAPAAAGPFLHAPALTPGAPVGAETQPAHAAPAAYTGRPAPAADRRGHADGHASTRRAAARSPMVGSHERAGNGRSPQLDVRAHPVARPNPRVHHGVDAGWLAGCSALIALAVILGRPRGPVRSARNCRVWLRTAVRPARH